MARVYFGCAMRGGRPNAGREELAALVKTIEGLGHEIASKHMVQEGIAEEEIKRSNTEIHDRDYDWLKDSDVGIFEISNASLGVGSEISDMLHLEKPVLCLFKKGLENSVSAYVRGKQGSKFVKGQIECRSYKSLDEAKAIIERFLGS